MCDPETGEVIRTFTSQHEAAQWLVDNGLAKNTNCASSINGVCQRKPCTTGYGYRKKAYGYDWQYAEKDPETSNWTITLYENDTPQIEQYPSVRTICPGEGCREHPKKQKRRCGNSSVAAAFLWPDSEKALKSRAFGQNEKVGNFYQNYLPFFGGEEGIRTLVRFRANWFRVL